MKVPVWDKEVDVVVVGSGGAGLTAALTAARAGARVLVLEKAPGLGGTTIFSGALAWIPNNHLMARAGIKDSVFDALAYMKECLGDDTDRPRRLAFLESGPEMIRFVEANSPLRFKLTPAPDSFAEKPYGLIQGRNIEPLPLNPSILKEWKRLLLNSPFRIGVPVTLGEAFAYTTAASGSMVTLLAGLKLGPRYLWRKMTGKLSLGPALVAGLLQGCKQAGVAVMVGTPADELITDNSRVVGVKTLQKGRKRFFQAHHGVILATGGFEWNHDMVKRYLPGPFDYPITSPFCTGDGHRMAQTVGARLGQMDKFMAWSVGFTNGRNTFHGAKLGIFINALLNNPHCIVVNRVGLRFVNEASHNAAQVNFYIDPETGQQPNRPAWSIFDSQWRRKYAEKDMGLTPNKPDPHWLLRADSVPRLAAKAGIDAPGLAATIRQFNHYAKKGRDEDFQRGENAYDRHFVAKSSGNPNLGSIDQPPYYAVRIHASTVGTKGGPITDEHCRVLDEKGAAIPGLLAAGTIAATIIGPITISSSSAIGLVMTQGYIAGKEAIRQMKSF